jgi:hypothetical protein
MRFYHHAHVALAFVALAGCAGAPGGGSSSVALTRAGQAVTVTESPTRTRYCEFLTDLPVQPSSADDADAVRALRNDAGAAGANLLLLVTESRTIDRAEGYLCVE